MSKKEEIQVIKIDEIFDKLPTNEAVCAMTLAFEELPIAQALVIIHGKEQAAKRYKEMGGHVRYNEKGEPVVLWKSSWAKDFWVSRSKVNDE